MLTAEYETSDGLKIEITESKVTVSKEGHSIDISEADFDFIKLERAKFKNALNAMKLFKGEVL